jgi:hypothetical protein
MRTAYKVGLGGAAIGAVSTVAFFWAKQRYAACMKGPSMDATGAIVDALVLPLICEGHEIDMLAWQTFAVAGLLTAAGGITVGVIQGAK